MVGLHRDTHENARSVCGGWLHIFPWGNRGSPGKPSQGLRWSMPPTSHQPSSTVQLLMDVSFPSLWTLQRPLSQFMHFMHQTMEGSRGFMMISGLSSQASSTATKEISSSSWLDGDFNVQLLDGIFSAPGAVGPHFHWKSERRRNGDAGKGRGRVQPCQVLRACFQEDMCITQTWMKKKHKCRITHTRPAGDEVQLDHAITPIQWRNMITGVSTVPGAALNSRREKPKLKKTRGPTEEDKELYNRRVANKLSQQPTHSPQIAGEEKQADTGRSCSQPRTQPNTPDTHNSTATSS